MNIIYNYIILHYTVCPTRYRTRHFFNYSNTNKDIATKFEQECVRCVRNEKECVCSAPNCCDTEQRSASQPVSCLTRLSAHNWSHLLRRNHQNSCIYGNLRHLCKSIGR